MALPELATHIKGEFTVRPVTWDDINAYREFLEIELRDQNEPAHITEDFVRSEWNSPRFDIATNTMAVFTPDNRVAGYVELWDTSTVPVGPYLWGFVHPDYRERGIGSLLMEWGEQRAHQVFDRVPADARVVLRAGALRERTDAKKLLEDFGMTTDRTSYTMLIEMDQEPAAPDFPDDYRIVTYAEMPDLRTFAHAHKESFRDHRGFIDTPLDVRIKHWEHWVESTTDFDPNLWFVAMVGDDVAAIVCGKPKDEADASRGWIDVLGVLRPYRRQGLGMAMLRYAFAEYWQRGVKRVGLGVDGASLTGATRLYERAGMHIHRTYDEYIKELRPGVELSKQSL